MVRMSYNPIPVHPAVGVAGYRCDIMDPELGILPITGHRPGDLLQGSAHEYVRSGAGAVDDERYGGLFDAGRTHHILYRRHIVTSPAVADLGVGFVGYLQGNVAVKSSSGPGYRHGGTVRPRGDRGP